MKKPARPRISVIKALDEALLKAVSGGGSTPRSGTTAPTFDRGLLDAAALSVDTATGRRR